VTLHPALDKEAIAEALKAASLEDICAELERKAKLCDDMAADCAAFWRHEDDSERRATHYNASMAFYKKAKTYRNMVCVAKSGE